MLDVDLGPDEQFLEVHESLVHTLGNLTGYNSAMSNNSFAVKREQLATSGVLMNQEIAHQHRWGRPEILARAATIADRVMSLWPGPIKVDSGNGSGTAWDVMNRALAELPAGAWTTYGDVAALIGSHSVAVGKRLATVAVPNGHRVLRAEGTVSPGFVWSDTTRHDDPHDTLAKEGVEFDDHQRANPAQRVSTEELAQLAGIDLDDLPERLPNLATGQTESLRDRFVEQLTDMQELTVVHGVLELLNAWVALGGTLVYGNAPSETSCFLITEATGGPSRTIWPVVLYPSGKVEVVFQHLRARPPFDQLGLREELRQRLNAVSGVDLPSAKIELRPGFSVDVLGDRERRQSVIDTVTWFYDQVQLDRQRHRSPDVS